MTSSGRFNWGKKAGIAPPAITEPTVLTFGLPFILERNRYKDFRALSARLFARANAVFETLIFRPQKVFLKSVYWYNITQKHNRTVFVRFSQNPS
jgi:hypothetical protein